MNTYEMTYIVRPDLDEDGTRAVVDALAGRLESNGGEVLATVPWNPPRRRMAYPIKDFGDGFYVTTVFHFDPQALAGFESGLKLNENVIRHLIVQATEQNVKQAQQRMQQAAAAARPQPAPETVADAPAPQTIAELPVEATSVPSEAATAVSEPAVEQPEPVLAPVEAPKVAPAEPEE